MLAPNAMPSIFKTYEAHLQIHECHSDTQTAHTATPSAPPALTSVASSTNDRHKFNIIHDHNYSLPGSAELKRRIDSLIDGLEIKSKKLKVSHQQKTRMHKKIVKLQRTVTSLKEVTGELQKKNLISGAGIEALEAFNNTTPGELLK